MKQAEEKVDILKVAIDALWDCPEKFTKQDIIDRLDKKGFEVKDIDVFLKVFIDKKLVFQEGEIYHIDITDVFEQTYGKEQREHKERKQKEGSF